MSEKYQAERENHEKSLEEKQSLTSCFKSLNKSMAAVLKENVHFNGLTSQHLTTLEGKRLEFENLKKEFDLNEILEKAHYMIGIVNEPAGLELQQLQESLQIYSKILEFNLNRLEQTQDLSDLLPVPRVPSLAKKFLEKFDRKLREIEEKQEKKEECFICTDNIEEGQEIVWCQANAHVVHRWCGAGWSQVGGGTCGMCREPMIVEMAQ